MKTQINIQNGLDTLKENIPTDFIISLEMEEAVAKLNKSEVSIRDVFMVSMEIETRRERLYYLLADMTKEDDIKNLYVFLAEEQNKHFKAFKKRLEENSKLIDLVEVFNNFNVNKIYTADKFFDLKILEGKLKNLSDIDSVYAFAISNVLDQILFYQKVKISTAESQRFFIDEIINEEHGYFLRLLRMKQTKGN